MVQLKSHSSLATGSFARVIRLFYRYKHRLHRVRRNNRRIPTRMNKAYLTTIGRTLLRHKTITRRIEPIMRSLTRFNRPIIRNSRLIKHGLLTRSSSGIVSSPSLDLEAVPRAIVQISPIKAIVCSQIVEQLPNF